MPRAADTGSDFAERLTLALKALNLSRAQLAAQVGVDKSLISRWASGQMKPTSHNLARISEVLAKVRPGFNTLMWERPRGEFEALLGIAADPGQAAAARTRPPTVPPPPAAPAAGPRIRPGWLPWGGAAMALALIVAAVLVWPRVQAGKAAAPPAAAASVSIAVMPFANLSGDPARDYFSDGFSVELLNTLANVPGLQVASRTDVFALKGKALASGEIARQLRVRYLLGGSVREDHGRIRVTVELIDAQEGRPVWSQEYDRDLTDVLKMQAEIARTVAGQLTHRLLSNAGPSPGTIDPAVYKEHLQALTYIFSDTPDGFQRAIALMRDVTRRQPDFADGFAQLGKAYFFLAEDDARRVDQRPLAEAAFRRALAIDPDNAQALTYLPGLLAHEWRWREAVQYADRLAATNAPDELKAVSRGYLVDAFALYPDLARALALTVERRPDHPFLRYSYGWSLGAMGDYRGALAQTREGLILAPNNPLLMGQQCFDSAMLGDLAAARATEAKLRELFRGRAMGDNLSLCMSAIAQRSGDLKALRILADDLARQYPGDGASSAWTIGFYYQQALDFDDAMVWYRRAYDRRESVLLQVPFSRPEVLSPAARGLFDDQRWKALWAQAPIQEWVEAREAYARR